MGQTTQRTERKTGQLGDGKVPLATVITYCACPPPDMINLPSVPLSFWALDIATQYLPTEHSKTKVLPDQGVQ